jgi:hypothetical protein
MAKYYRPPRTDYLPLTEEPTAEFVPRLATPGVTVIGLE